MSEINLELIQKQTREATDKLLELAALRKGEILVVGCSTSEVTGAKIGSASNEEVGKAMIGCVLESCKKAGVYLAVQCCEHLNRAIVLERECARLYHLEEVNVRPVKKAGGAFATAAYASLEDPVVVEFVKGHGGLDIGDTIIGMHLRPVVVPLRTECRTIGCAHVVMARTRRKFIGGPRAQYDI